MKKSLMKMECLPIAVLLGMVLVTSAYGQSCDTRTCGTNAECTISEGRPVCTCLDLYMGDPLVRCIRVECQINEDCPTNRACSNNMCIDPCRDACGQNAQCEIRNRSPVCTCPPAYTGDPYSSCSMAESQ